MDMTADIAYQLLNAPDAKAVVFGSVRTTGLLDSNDAPVFEEIGLTAQVRTTTLYIQPGTLPGLVQDSQITVGGVAYVVRQVPTARVDGLLPIRVAEVAS